MVEASISWPIDQAPEARISVANPNGRRGNYLDPGDEWWLYVARGAVSGHPLFIGTQPPNFAPSGDDPLVLELQGFSANMNDRRMEVNSDKRVNDYGGWEVMSAIADVFTAGEPRIDARGLYGTKPAIAVPEGHLGAGAPFRAEVIGSLLELAVDDANPDNLRPWHWIESPLAAGPAVLQVAEIDPLAGTQPTAAVLDAEKDIYMPPRSSYNTRLFNEMWYKDADGIHKPFAHGDRPFGLVSSRDLAPDHETANRRVEQSRRVTRLFEFALRAAHFDLCPGAIVQVTNAGPASGYFQIREVRHAVGPTGARTTIRVAEPILPGVR